MATFSPQSSIDKGSDAVKEYSCTTCEEKNLEKCADSYCEACLRFFCGKCIQPHDQAFTKRTTYGKGDTKKWPVSEEVEDFLQKCDVHKDEKLKMFCEDHNKLCCTNCAFLNHRQCTKVTLISESVKKHSTDLQQLSVKLQTILEEIKKLQTNWEINIHSLQGSYDKQLHKVRETRRKINAAFDEIGKNTLKQMKETLNSLQASLKNDVENCTRLRDELKRLREVIQDISDKSKEELSFIASKKCLDKIQQSEAYLKEKSVQVKHSLSFQANGDIEQYLSKLSGLGRIVHSNQTLTVQGNPDQAFTVKQNSEYNVAVSGDSSQVYTIIGICALSNGQILVADWINKRVKLLDQQYQVVCVRDMSASPQDICQISPCEVAVTVDDGGYTHQVQFISVNNGQLVKSNKLQLQHYCGCIAHHNGDLYVTDTTALYKYTLSGKLVSKLYKDTSVHRCAVSPTGDVIYVTNTAQHKLLTLARDGSVLNSFTDPELQQPLGVHVTPAGQVLVCGFLSHTIIQVDSQGRKKLATVATQRDGVRNPLSVCYNNNTASIIVGQDINYKILVFEVQ